MIESIEVKGFKTLRDVTILLAEGITVLVGANNSGKSNIVKLFELIAATARIGDFRKAATLFGGLESLVTRGDKPQMSIVVNFRDRDSIATYRLGWEPDCEVVSYSIGGGAEVQVARDDQGRYKLPGGASAGGPVGFGLRMWSSQDDAPAPVSALQRALINIIVRDLSVPAMRAPSPTRRGAELGRDGLHLAAVLDDLNPDLLDAVGREVRTTAPEIKRVLARNADEPGTKIVGVVEGRGEVFTANELSDGLLLFIGLSVSVALAGSARSVLAIEEPERGVHPRRIRDLVDMLKDAAVRGSQVVVTTHSPELLNEFRDQPESVLILDRDESGTHVIRLSDREEWVAELQDKSLGDIWYSGVLGGVPRGPGK